MANQVRLKNITTDMASYLLEYDDYVPAPGEAIVVHFVDTGKTELKIGNNDKIILNHIVHNRYRGDLNLYISIPSLFLPILFIFICITFGIFLYSYSFVIELVNTLQAYVISLFILQSS